MIKKKLTLINKLGLHARAAAKFVTIATHYSSEILINYHDKQVNGKSIMDMMMLALTKNAEIEITAEGEDEIEALQALEKLVSEKFGEEK